MKVARGGCDMASAKNEVAGSPPVRLHAFGDPTLRGEEGAPLDRLTRRTKRFAFLIYLATGEGRVPRRRDELLAMFWPESDKDAGLNALRQTLFVIRRELGPDSVLGVGAQELVVNWDRLASDVDAFYGALARGDLESALALYRGDFLSGFHVSGAPDFSFWVEDQRASLRDLAGRGAKDLARRAEAEHSLPGAVYWWRRAFDFYPYDESTLCRIMSLLTVSGNRTQALDAFERFRRRAELELGVAPSPLTLKLVGRIRAGGLDGRQRWLAERRRPEGDTGWSGSKRATDRAGY